MFHLLRYMAASAFVSVSVAIVLHSGKVNYARMTEFVSHFNEALMNPAWIGHWSLDNASGIAALSGEVGRQAFMIGYINAFAAYTILSIAILPLVFFVRVPKRAADDSSNEP